MNNPNLVSEHQVKTPSKFSEMKTYSPSSLSQLKASPLTLGDYNDLQGWTLPEGQDPTQEGFLIEDSARSKNHDLFKHGITWMDKASFEAAYIESGTHIDRTRNEYRELSHRINVADALFPTGGNEISQKIENQFQQDLLWVQLQLMKQTRVVMGARVTFSEPCDVMDYKNYRTPSIVRNVTHNTAMLFAELGYPILREGWNGVGLYVFVAGAEELCKTPEAEHEPLLRLNPFTCITRIGGETNAWVASPTDLQANDWVVLFKMN